MTNPPLPAITNVVTIDGTTETNFNPITAIPIVEINGAKAGVGATGFDLQSSNCIIRGLAINRFSGDAIYLEGAGGNVIQGNLIGTGVRGTNALGNGTNGTQGGILVISPNNLIGGTSPTNRNIISANAIYGIHLSGSGAVGNIVQGNYIGPDITGTKRFTNSANGIAIDLTAASNVIGGILTGAGNVISGNSQSGIYIVSGNGNMIQGNFIGTDASGTNALSNSSDGITIVGGPNINDPNPSKNTQISRNVISGNATNAITITGGNNSIGTFIQANYIGVSSNGLGKIANGLNGVTILNVSSNTLDGNIISGNTAHGIFIGSTVARGNVIQNNLIGLDATGTNAIGNGQDGVRLTGSVSISGNLVGPSNVISGNFLEGVAIDNLAKANLVQGNLIGTDITGQRSLGNRQNGVRIESAGNTIGGLTTGVGNTISGNTNYGIYIYGIAASNTLVQGNFIGVNSIGTAALSNAYAGIALIGAPTNTIGGPSPAARNLISGNYLYGISILSNSAAGNIIQGNYIGTDWTGTSALANGNGLASGGNAGGGIDISAAPFTLIGGTLPGAGNLISGNRWDGIAIGDNGASNSVIQGNFIGVKVDGILPLANDQAGVEIRNTGGGGGTIIGGSQSGAGNVLANASLIYRCGVRIQSGPGNTNILVRGNSIYGNGGTGGYGIFLGPIASAPYPITPNDPCDLDGGANQLQNYPVLTFAYCDGLYTTIAGTLNSTTNSTFLLQFNHNTPPVAGNVQGQYFLGDTMMTNGLSCGDYPFSIRFTNALPVGQLITATATDAANNTSEFSPAVAILPPPRLTGGSLLTGGDPQLVLSWPTTNLAANTFTVVQATNLTPPIVWTPLTNAPVIVSTNFTITLTSTNDQRYYRLSL